MEIVSATYSHVPEIVDLWKEFMDYGGSIDPLFSRREDGHLNFERYLKDLIKSDNSLVLVALDKGHVVAYSISQIFEYPPVFPQEKYGFISDMAVKSKYPRKGIGSQMLAKIFEWFESRNMDKIELHVLAENQIGYSFWKKHGFKDYMHVLYLNRKIRNEK
ncbi:MAG: GNAT family N-acetyltransferase [Candidatus Jordarchaeaceae archaeon]